MRMRSLPLGALVVASVLAARVHAQPVDQPSTLTLDAAVTVSRACQATRAHLLGLVDLYDVGIYADRAPIDRQGLLSAGVPKAVRVEIRYKEDLRRRPVIDWQRELVPRLEPAAVTLLRGAYGTLRQGDVILVEYMPEKGTSVRVNRAVAVSGADHELMLAFLDHWIGQQPVSEELKRALLGS